MRIISREIDLLETEQKIICYGCGTVFTHDRANDIIGFREQPEDCSVSSWFVYCPDCGSECEIKE